MPVDIEAIRERSQAFEDIRGHPVGVSNYRWSAVAERSAADVAPLLDYIADLRAALAEERAAHALSVANAQAMVAAIREQGGGL